MNDTKIERVLVVVKPEQRGLPPAAYHARVLAERFGAKVTLMSVIYESTVGARLERGRTGAADARQGMLDAERVRLERVATSLRDWGVPVEIDVRWHRPTFEAIVQAVHDLRADIVAVDVLDAPGLHTRLTETDWQLMRHCPCPVLYVNNAEFAAYDTVLAAVDPMHVGRRTDETDRVVLSFAGAFAHAFGATLRAVHAYPDPAAYSWLSAVQVSPGVFFGTENIGDAHRLAVEALVGEFGIDAAAIEARPGEPADVIVEVAAELGAGLIVLGALERGGVEEVLLGSTTETVAAEASCDVLLVKATDLRGS